MSKIEVDTVVPQSGTTITIGESGDTVALGSGATQTGFGTTNIDDNGTATAITIDSSNNVGIKNSSPSHTLDISDTSTTAKTLRVGQSSGVSNADATMIISNGGTGDAMLRFDYEGSNTDRARLGTSSSGQNLLFFTAGNNERMRIDSSGELLIGTTSSITTSGKLSVQGSSSNDQYLSFIRNTNTSLGQGMVIRVDHTNNRDILLCNANGTDVFKVRANGNVGINTNSPEKLLEVQGTSSYNTAVFLVENNNTSTFNSQVLEVRGGRATTNGSYYLIQGTNGNSSGIFRVFDNGDVRNTNNSYGGISDQKLKENIVDANSQWNDIKSLPIRKYSLTHENSATPTQIGVIAQELESAGMNGLVEETVDRDEEGNDLGTTTKSVKYSVLYMKAVKALQEALTEIDNLKARVNTLEGN